MDTVDPNILGSVAIDPLNVLSLICITRLNLLLSCNTYLHACMYHIASLFKLECTIVILGLGVVLAIEQRGARHVVLWII